MHPYQKAELLLKLRSQILANEQAAVPPDATTLSTGIPPLDGVLPSGGIRPGSLVEWLSEPGGGAQSLAMLLVREACRTGRYAVVLDDGQFYPPAAALWGVPLQQLIIVRTPQPAEALWAADQALRSPAVAAVWLHQDRLRPHDFRRLRLAAGAGTAIGLLFRPLRVHGQPSWADLQFAVKPLPSPQHRRLHVELTRCRGGNAGAEVNIELETCHEANPLSASAPLARSATARRRAKSARPADPAAAEIRPR